jgi:hypothetical protein
VFMLGEGSDNKWRFDTGDGGGGHGAKLHTGAGHTRSTAGFTPRHWSGS